MSYYYDLCSRHRGKVVTIYEKCGKVHVGRIVSVDHQNVYIEPITRGVSSFNWGFWGFGAPFFFPVALAAIGGLALGAAFFW